MSYHGLQTPNELNIPKFGRSAEEVVRYFRIFLVKFIFSKKATKIDEIFTVDLTFTTLRQIDGEDFVNFCSLLRKHEL